MDNDGSVKGSNEMMCVSGVMLANEKHNAHKHTHFNRNGNVN